MEKIIEELINSLTDDQFLEFHEKVKKEAELIKKQKRLNEIDQKFRDKGIKCPNCQSFYCVLCKFKQQILSLVIMIITSFKINATIFLKKIKYL
ncbi:hypothetical protein [Spiroplasma endosymbiont of Poecilobothrus nobilitatus]|uniref:hypothetical protein n=1 Tax=Spiroplasma endosymbiont of Poecilobothrus nobilitatus TaxID=1209220 RepID=UPI00313BD511